VNGRVIFIPGVEKGEKLRIRITKIHSNIAFAVKVGDLENTDSGKD